ncbi:hypothetical protein ACMA1I_20950 [Pontibacter sp. 13R65]|uniref:hypothetical protein n=1 Tax=Pontibacter sp. 13R65 TaxID=3127458 RepID=UPI00301E5C23
MFAAPKPFLNFSNENGLPDAFLAVRPLGTLLNNPSVESLINLKPVRLVAILASGRPILLAEFSLCGFAVGGVCPFWFIAILNGFCGKDAEAMIAFGLSLEFSAKAVTVA